MCCTDPQWMVAEGEAGRLAPTSVVKMVVSDSKIQVWRHNMDIDSWPVQCPLNKETRASGCGFCWLYFGC